MAGRGGGWGLAPAGQSLLLIVAARFVQRLVDLIDGGYGLEGRRRRTHRTLQASRQLRMTVAPDNHWA